MLDIHVCPGTLADGFTTYSRTCLKQVFNGKTVIHLLPYYPPQLNEGEAEKFRANREHLSISGVQEKYSVILDKNKLRLTEPNEKGNYILKPIPVGIRKNYQIPANEHLTMQIATQVYGIQVAPNAMIFYQNGEPAYITKRFDVKEDSTKWGKEDFASLAGKTTSTHGTHYKYEGSYEEIGDLIKKYVPASIVELEKLFALVVFNFLFSNGDAHLKNFALLETPNGDNILSPAYDLINTSIHIDDQDFAMKKGLFNDSFQSEVKRKTGHVGLEDFVELANRFGIMESRRVRILEPFLRTQPLVKELVSRSFLNDKTQALYLDMYESRLRKLNMQ